MTLIANRGLGWGWAACLVAFLLPIRALAPLGIGSLTPGVILAVFLGAVILPSLKHYPYARLVFGLALGSAPAGLFLAWFATDTHQLTQTITQSTTLLIVCAGITFAALVWCTRVQGLAPTVLAFLAGTTVQALLTPSAWSTSWWKYAFSWPLAIAVLVVLSGRSRALHLTALGAIGAMSIAFDYRSFFGFALFVAVVILFPRTPGGGAKRAPAAIPLAVLAATSFAIYRASEWLAVNGYLGERNRYVTEVQTATDSSLLGSSRPELGAAYRLFLERPFGYGPGVVPNTPDVLAGKEGLRALGAPSDRYVNEYMFTDHFELHGIVSDFWINFGLMGLTLAVVVGVLVATQLVNEVRRPRPNPYVLLVLVVGAWDLLFSPIQSNWSHVVLAAVVAVALGRSMRAATTNNRPAESARVSQVKAAASSR